MANFSQFFSDESDLYNELTSRTPTPLTDGQLLQIDSTTSQIVGYDLISGTGNTQIVTETTETAVLDLSVTPDLGTSGSTDISTVTYTSTATEDLSSVFAAGDYIYFSGEFSNTGEAINVTGTAQGYAPDAAFGTGTYLFAFPIASVTGSSGSWTIVLNLNEPPFKSWVEDSTEALVRASNGLSTTDPLPTSYPSTLQTEIFFATAVTTGNLDVTLRTTTTTSNVEISQFADGDLEIAGINADGVIINLTSGDFGTAGQAVIVNATADGLTFGASIPEEIDNTNDLNVTDLTVKFWNGTEAQFADLTTRSSDTLYITN